MSCPLNPVDCIKSVAGSAASSVFSSMARDFAKAADSTINWLWAQLSTATAVHLGGAAFDQLIGVALAIAALMAVGIFVLQLMVSAVRRDAGGVGRAAGGLLLMSLGTGFAIAATELLLAAVDALCAGVLAVTTGGTEQQLGNDILGGGVISGFTSNPAGLMLVSLFALIASVIVWLALVVRKLLIIVAAVMAPFAFAGGLADFSRSWVRRWVELVAALIFSKLIMVFIFVIGLYVLIRGVGSTGTGVTQTATQTACGILILALAGLAPWVAVRLAHFGGEHLAAVHHQTGAAAHGARQAWSMARPVGAAATSGTAAGPVFGAFGRSRGGGGTKWEPDSASNGRGAPPAPPTNGNGNGNGKSSPTGVPSTGQRRPSSATTDEPVSANGTETSAKRTEDSPVPDPARRGANVRDDSALMHALDRAYFDTPRPKGEP